MSALSGLARSNPQHLRELLTLTDRISKENPTGRLASETAYFAIQGFVLGARLEDMPEERRHLGTRERYEAFLEDYPKSVRAPLIGASLVRTLVAMSEVDEAAKWVKRMRDQYPDHSATRRAEGELSLAQALGKPYTFEHTMPDGKKLRTGDYSGNVLILHFWASWNEEAVKAIPELVRLYAELEGRGLRIVGVNVDSDRKQADEAIERLAMTWPQFFDKKGFRSEVIIRSGVVRIPSYLVIDRKGVLHSTDPGDGLSEMVRRLVAAPSAAPTSGKAGDKKAEP
jgi:thiol-disulfide isomerase/thioredoxin